MKQPNISYAIKTKLGMLYLFFIWISVISWFWSVNVLAATSLNDQYKDEKYKIANAISDQITKDISDNKKTTDSQNEQTTKDFFQDATYDNFEPQKDLDILEDGHSTPQIDSQAKIDPGAVTIIQATFLHNITSAFSVISGYALNLLYLFAVLELVIFGLVWAIQRDVGWDKLFFKVLKIGLIFFVIRNYAWFLDVIMRSFSQLAGVVLNNDAAAKYVLNPAKIWQYGYDSGVYLLKLAVGNSNNFGLAMVQISLGMGVLFVFGLIGIQVVMQIVGFYLISLGALILLPFGTFILSGNMFDKAVQSVLQAGIRLMTVIIVIGIGVVIWEGYKLADLTVPVNGTEMVKFNLNQSLGLFFTGLLFLLLAFFLPRILSQAVGKIGGTLFADNVSSSAAIRDSGGTSILVSSGTADLKAATTIEGDSGINVAGGYGPGTPGSVTPTAVTVTSVGGGGIEAKLAKGSLGQASNISKSISEGTVKRIKEAIAQAAKENKQY